MLNQYYNNLKNLKDVIQRSMHLNKKFFIIRNILDGYSVYKHSNKSQIITIGLQIFIKITVKTIFALIIRGIMEGAKKGFLIYTNHRQN